MNKNELIKMNWLRAGVLGANDGIVSVAAILVGAAAASASLDNRYTTILIAAVAGLLAGALSMAAGEYVSVSAQRDAEMEAHSKRSTGSSEEPHLTNPWHAAVASFIAFAVGASIPLAAGLLSPSQVVIPVTFAAVILALMLTGYLSAVFAEISRGKSIIRNVIGGSFSMLVTYLLGVMFELWIL